MSLSLLVMLGVFALNVLTPGASFVLTTHNAMQHGRKTGMLIGLGLATADAMFSCAAVAGLAALVSQHLLVVKGISLLGGLWFVYGGLHALLRKKAKHLPEVAEQTKGALHPRLAYQLGFTAGAFNPQAIIFFSTMFLAALTLNPSLAQAAVLVGGVAVVSVLTRFGIVLLFTTQAVVGLYHAKQRIVEAFSASALTAFGLKLAVPAAALLISHATSGSL